MVFLLWMAFFDRNDLVSQYQFYQKRKELQTINDSIRQDVLVLKAQKERLATNEEQERIAREKYLMKTNDETIFIIETKDTLPKR